VDYSDYGGHLATANTKLRSIEYTTEYCYDVLGKVTARGSHTLTWTIENQLASYYDGSTTTTFVYDGDGKRGKKTVGGTTTLYVNKDYEKTGDTAPGTTGLSGNGSAPLPHQMLRFAPA